MSEHDDVSWEMVEQVVRDWLGSSAQLEEISFLSGGIVNTTLALRTRAGERAVLKISPHRANFSHEREARALLALAALGLPMPGVYDARTATLESPHSYLLIEHIAGMTLREARVHCPPAEWDAMQDELADHVATIHAITGETYGRFEAASFTEWPTFYKSLVDPVWAQAQKMHCLPVRTRKTIGRVHERLDVLLAHGDVPRLCHGDLWASNVLCAMSNGGRWQVTAIIDPDLRNGHAEAEIAYMELFKTIGPRFKQAYQRRFRLADHYHSVRRPVYQLYGLVNQLQLHGAAHAPSVIAAAERLATIV